MGFGQFPRISGLRAFSQLMPPSGKLAALISAFADNRATLRRNNWTVKLRTVLWGGGLIALMVWVATCFLSPATPPAGLRA
jgi:hypothetical protein